MLLAEVKRSGVPCHANYQESDFLLRNCLLTFRSMTATINNNRRATFLPQLQVRGDVRNFIPGNVRVATVEEVMYGEETWPQKGSVLVAICISMKHVSSSNNANVSRGSRFNPQRSKQQKIPGSAWQRMFVFADLSSPGQCFVMLFDGNHAAGSKAFKHSLGGSIVGTPFYIVEGSCTRDKKQFGPLPLVHTQCPLVPIRYPNTAEGNVASLAKTLRLHATVPAGDQRYFVMNGYKYLQLDMFRLVCNGTCNGLACDRAQKLGAGHKCGCFHVNLSNGGHVGEFDVCFANPLGMEIHAEEFIRVDGHRSLHTTKLFFKDFRGFCSGYNDEDHFLQVREGVQQCVDYVNQRGGWTIVCWFRQGEVADMSEEGAERIENDTVTVHISLLTPTDAGDIDSASYKAKMIGHNAGSNELSTARGSGRSHGGHGRHGDRRSGGSANAGSSGNNGSGSSSSRHARQSSGPATNALTDEG